MYYSNLDRKNVTDHEPFWKTVKPFSYHKLTHKEKINLSGNWEILKTDAETANVLNTFFSNVVQNLNISWFPDSNPLIQNIKNPTPEAILKVQHNCYWK